MSSFWILMLVACGGSGADLGVSGGKRLADIDEEETCTMWEGFSEWQSNLSSASCTLLGQGLGLAGAAQGQPFEAACVAARDDCLTNGSLATDTFVCANVQTDIPATCDVTVREVETCLDDTLALFDDVLSVGCDEPLDAAVFAALQAQGQSGDAVPDSCAGFYGTDCLGSEQPEQ